MWALGLMSGTSLDGVDVALIETDGVWVRDFGPSMEVPFSDELKAELREATAAALRWGFEGPVPNSLARAADLVDAAHVEALRRFADEYPEDFARAEIVGYHGQTVAHDPAKGRTLQLGNGQALAYALGIPCVFDFRSADVAAGGEGAPLAPVYHRALVEAAGLEEGTAVLNLGGVGNVTVFTPDLAASDTGPGNGPLDEWMARHGQEFDADGAASLSGTPDFALIDAWLRGPFFRRLTPRSADRYEFDVLDDLHRKRLEDGAATLAAFTAQSVKATLRQMGHATRRLIVCGGGRRNPALMRMLAAEMEATVEPAEAVGWDGDALEAQAFAFLAVRSLEGLPLSYPATTGVKQPTLGGRIVRPGSRPA